MDCVEDIYNLILFCVGWENLFLYCVDIVIGLLVFSWIMVFDNCLMGVDYLGFKLKIYILYFYYI